MTSVVTEVRRCEKFIYFSSLFLAEDGWLTQMQEMKCICRKHWESISSLGLCVYSFIGLESCWIDSGPASLDFWSHHSSTAHSRRCKNVSYLQLSTLIERVMELWRALFSCPCLWKWFLLVWSLLDLSASSWSCCCVSTSSAVAAALHARSVRWVRHTALGSDTRAAHSCLLRHNSNSLYHKKIIQEVEPSFRVRFFQPKVTVRQVFIGLSSSASWSIFL